jgi:glucokinase
VHIINPGAIVIGGGVSQSGAFLFEPIRTALAEHIMNSNYMDELILTRAVFGDEVGLVGALALGRTIVPPPPNEHE